MTTTAATPFPRLAEDGEISVAVQTELMMDYRMVSPFADASKTLAAAAFETSQAGFFTITSSGGVAMVTPDSSSDTGWGVTDLQFPSGTYGTVIDVAAYQDWYSATVVWACTTSGVYYASSLYQWAWTPAELGQPTGSVIGGVRGLNCAYANKASVVAVEVQQTNYPSPQSQLYCQPSGQPAYNNMITYPGAFLDWSAGPVVLPGVPAPQPGAFVCVPGDQGNSEPPGVMCISDNAENNPLFLAGTYPVLATALNSSGWLEAFVIDAGDNNSLNYLSPSGFTFTKIPIAQPPGDNGQQVTSYPIGSVAAVTDLGGIIHVIACTTTGTVLHIASSADSETGWDIAAPITDLNSPAELTAATDEDGDVHVFARADRTGAVSHLVLAVTTGDWTTETISIEVPHQDYVQQIATYSATLSVLAPNGMAGCGLQFSVSATEPVTVQIDGAEADLDKEIAYPGITGPDGQVVIVWPTSSLSMPTLYAWFEGMPQADSVAIDMSGPIQATINGVTSGEELLALPTQFSYKTYYTSGSLLDGVNPADADTAAAAIDAVMGLANQAEISADRLHPSSRPHAARYITGWDGTPVDRIDRTGRPDQYFRLNFAGGRSLYEPLDADGANAARAELLGAGTWLPDVSWSDVFCAVADAAGSVTAVVVNAVGDAIDATITMVVAGVTYVWDAVVQGAGHLLDLVQTIFSSLQADFWALVGWLGWVFNWNDILLTHQAISYFLTNGIAWAKYAMGQVQGTIDQAIIGIQADIKNAVATYLGSQVASGSTVASLVQDQPAPPAGTDLSADPRNIFSRGLRANGNSATITASDVQPSPAVVTAAEALLAQAGGYASAVAGSTQMQAFVTQAEPTKANTAGILDQPLAEIIQAAADGASWGLGLVQDGVDTMFGLAAEAIDGASTMLTQTWDIPLVTDIYKWVTNGSDLSALDVTCLLLAVPATITYKVMFGEAPIPDQAGLDAIMAAYPAPPATGSDRALPADAPASTALAIGQRLGNILTGLSYIACGHFEAQVDVGIALWTIPGSTQTLKDPRCPAGWRGQWWVEKPGMIWEALYVATEAMSSVFSWIVTFAPNSDNLDCGTVEGMANWMWIIGNLQWVLDFTALVFEETVVQALWQGTGPGFITLWGCVQLALQIVIWFRLGSKGWPGSAGGLLTSLPNAGKFLMSPYMQKAFDNVPIPALIEAMIDGAGNLYGGLLYVLNAAITT
jgi:hypothetical protein